MKSRLVIRQPSALFCLLVLLAAAACSSPTAPTTPPPVATPAPTPTPPTTPAAPPELTIACPANQSATATTGGTAAVTFDSPSATGGVAPVQLSCTRQSGSPFTIGTTTVQCTATDSASASASCTFNVTVTGVIPRLTRTRFLAFGDSITAGEVTTPVNSSFGGQPNYGLIIVPDAAYPTQLANQLRARYTAQATVIDVINSGWPGEWAEDGVLRLPGVLAATRPEAVLLLEGYNDLGAYGSAGINVAMKALDTMAKDVRNRGARLFLATLPPAGPTGAKGISDALVTALNERIRSTAKGEGAVLVDLYAALKADVARYVGVDGLHLTEAGYLRVSELFFDAIRADLEVR